MVAESHLGEGCLGFLYLKLYTKKNIREMCFKVLKRRAEMKQN